MLWGKATPSFPCASSFPYRRPAFPAHRASSRSRRCLRSRDAPPVPVLHSSSSLLAWCSSSAASAKVYGAASKPARGGRSSSPPQTKNSTKPMRKLNSKPPRMLRLSRRNPPRRASLQGQPLAMNPSVASRQGQPRFRRLSRRNPSRRASPSPSLGSSGAGLAVVARGMRDLSPYESGLAARPSAGQPPPPWCLSACSGAPRCRRLRGTRRTRTPHQLIHSPLPTAMRRVLVGTSWESTGIAKSCTAIACTLYGSRLKVHQDLIHRLGDTACCRRRDRLLVCAHCREEYIFVLVSKIHIRWRRCRWVLGQLQQLRETSRHGSNAWRRVLSHHRERRAEARGYGGYGPAATPWPWPLATPRLPRSYPAASHGYPVATLRDYPPWLSRGYPAATSPRLLRAYPAATPWLPRDGTVIQQGREEGNLAGNFWLVFC